MMKNRNQMGSALLRRLRATTIFAVFPLALGACGDILSVDNPTDILETDLEDPAVVTALANSGEAAVVDIYDIVVQYGELPGDAVVHASTNQGNLALDRGILQEVNERSELLYNELSAARWTATEVTRRLEELVADPSSSLAIARSLYWDALARITLADLIEEVPFDGGPPQAPADVYVGAIELLERAAAVAQAAGSTQYVAASHATIARAYRSLYFERGADLSTFQRAAEHAERSLEADPNFTLFARYAIPGSSNGLFGAWLGTVQYDVMDDDYANQVDPVSGLRDTRIQHSEFTGLVSTFGDSIYTQLKYPDRSADIRVSSWQEAELILAEHSILQGDPSEALVHLNRVRGAAGLPALSSGAASEVRGQLIYERKTEFWLELRRWQDMRYYGIVPERWSPDMQAAGVDRRFPVSLRERLTNPNY